MLLKANQDAGLKVNYYTLLAWLGGTPATYGVAGAERVKTLIGWHPNVERNRLEKFANDFRAKYKEDFIYIAINRAIEMLAQAINQAKSSDPLKVAYALEGMKYQSATGEAWMRAGDHQIMVPLYIAKFTKAGSERVKYEAEKTGYGWATEAQFQAKDTVLPNTCAMQRPQR